MSEFEEAMIFVVLVWLGLMLVLLAHVPSFDIPILKALGIHPDMQY